MTLPSSGQISLADVKAEFGGNASPKITDYYAGGAFVTAGTVSPITGAVPSSGQIGLFNFYGCTAFTPHNDDFSSGSGTVPVPSGAVQLVVEVWGKGGDGGNGATGGSDHQGGGGGAGGYSKSIIALSSDAGKTITYNANGGPSTVTATLTAGSVSLSAAAGAAGFNATGTLNGNGNSGGTSSGGNTTNTTGGTGTNGNTAGSGGQGAAANNGRGAGGQGGYTVSNNGRTLGSSGGVKLTWT